MGVESVDFVVEPGVIHSEVSWPLTQLHRHDYTDCLIQVYVVLRILTQMSEACHFLTVRFLFPDC